MLYAKPNKQAGGYKNCQLVRIVEHFVARLSPLLPLSMRVTCLALMAHVFPCLVYRFSMGLNRDCFAFG